jgi:hypothetical protein
LQRSHHDAEISIFAAFPRKELAQERARLLDMISAGRI